MTFEALAVGMWPLFVDLVLAVGLLGALAADVIAPAGEKRAVVWASLFVVLAALGVALTIDPMGWSIGRAYRADELTSFLRVLFLSAGALALLPALDAGPARWPRRQGEYALLVLSSTLGMTLLAGAHDVVLLVVAFELMSVPLYVMAAWTRDDPKAVEGATKLLLSGALSSSAILYGLGLLSGLAGSTALDLMADHATQNPTPMAAIGAAIALAGVGFKVGVVPFHFWVPDTYEGSPTPALTFLAVGPKLAGVVALVRVLLAGGGGLAEASWGTLVGLATITLVGGNLLALQQPNVKRLLAFSGVGHMGLMLVPLALGTDDAVASLLFYGVAYLFTNAGAFLVVHAVGGDGSVSSFDGLARRHAGLGLVMLVFLLSLGGIPFAVGFWAKLYVFLAAWNAGLEWFVVLGALVSVVGLFYYLRIARAMFMTPAPEGAGPVPIEPSTAIGLTICLVAVLGIGLVPGPVIDAAIAAAAVFSR